MRYELDPELVTVMAELGSPTLDRDDWQMLRRNGEIGQAYMANLVPPSSGIRITSYETETDDGARIELRWYRKGGAQRNSAVVYAHGGGMVLGTLDLYDEVISRYVDLTEVPFLSVGYRRAPDEGTGTMLAEDVFAGLCWLLRHADKLGVDPARIAVMGDSGGGGPAAGAAILARDRHMSLARQILVYPMLDDRNQIPDPARLPYLTWTYDNNYTAWHAVLGDQYGTDNVPPTAAPARLTDHSGLAPAYLEVGDLDIFRDETIGYAAKLAMAGVPIELHVHPGAAHGWERFAPHCESAIRAMNDRVRVVSAL